MRSCATSHRRAGPPPARAAGTLRGTQDDVAGLQEADPRRPPGPRDTAQEERVEDLREQASYLRWQLDEEREARRRADTILVQLSAANAEQARTIRALEAPSEPAEEAPEGAETVEEAPEGSGAPARRREPADGQREPAGTPVVAWGDRQVIPEWIRAAASIGDTRVRFSRHTPFCSTLARSSVVGVGLALTSQIVAC
jgi:hypothetical protein